MCSEHKNPTEEAPAASSFKPELQRYTWKFCVLSTMFASSPSPPRHGASPAFDGRRRANRKLKTRSRFAAELVGLFQRWFYRRPSSFHMVAASSAVFSFCLVMDSAVKTSAQLDLRDEFKIYQEFIFFVLRLKTGSFLLPKEDKCPH